MNQLITQRQLHEERRENREKPMAYDVIEGEDIRSLTAQINERLRNGWVLHGGLQTVSEDGNGVWFYQAMTKGG